MSATGSGGDDGGEGPAKTRADDTPDPRSSAPRRQRTGTYPPAHWDRASGVISSTGDAAAEARAPGPLAGDTSERLTEARAREILGERFRAAGLAIRPDYPFHERDLAVTLDAYDPDEKVGYAFVSHADADVVTDLDDAAELALDQLAADGVCHVLVVHDGDAPTRDALDRLVDAFFAGIRPA